MRDYRQANTTVDISLETELAMTKMRDIATALEEDTYRIEQLTEEITVANDILLQLERFREDSRTLSESEQLSELKSLFIDVAVELERLKVEHAADHPYVREGLAKIRKVRELIEKEPESSVQLIRQAINPLYDSLTEKVAQNELEIRGARARREPLEQTLTQYREQLITIPERNMKLELLQRNLSVESETYEALLKVQVQMQVAESMVLSNMLIVDEANLPAQRDFPSRKVNWILGFFLAIAMALMTALTWEYVARAKEEMDLAEMGPTRLEPAQLGMES